MKRSRILLLGMVLLLLASTLVFTGCGPKALARQAFKLEQQMEKLEMQALFATDDNQLEKLEAQYEKLEARLEKLTEKYEKLSEKDQKIAEDELERLSSQQEE